jgi:hypothetical protein
MTGVGRFLVDVPFKSNGKSARFFDDHVEFNEQSIRYDEIETLTTNGGTTIHKLGGIIPVGRSFDGLVQFKTSSGKTAKIIMTSLAIFGIPVIRNPRRNAELFPPLFDAVYSIVAKSMAQKYIDMIQGGATVEVAGLIINHSAAASKTKAKASKDPVAIHKGNYHDCQLTGPYSVAVFDKQGEKIWSSSIWDYKNVLLIPHILDAIF